MNETIKARAAVDRLAVVVHDSSDAISVQGLDGRILAWNPAAEKMFGWSEKEALGMHNRDRIPEQQREKAEADINQLCRAEALESYHTQRLTKDGRSVDVWLTATVLTDKAGQIYAIAMTERGVLPYGS
jgi:two-component system CheB/CheR fusion protein